MDTPPPATGRLGEYSFTLKRRLPRCFDVTRPDLLLLGRLLVDWEHCCDLAENTVDLTYYYWDDCSLTGNTVVTWLRTLLTLKTPCHTATPMMPLKLLRTHHWSTMPSS